MITFFSTSQLNAQICRQESSRWCWASCIKRALEQVQIVAMLSGWPQNKPARMAVVSDPAKGMNYEQNVTELYNAWNWSRSILVVTP